MDQSELLGLFATSLVFILVYILWYLDKILDERRDLKRQLEEQLSRNDNGDHSYFSSEESGKSESISEELDDLEEDDVSDADAQRFRVALEACSVASVYSHESADLERFKSLIGKAIQNVEKIEDEFYRDAAYHKIIISLHQAGLKKSASKILSRVSIDMIREKIMEELETTAH